MTSDRGDFFYNHGGISVDIDYLSCPENLLMADFTVASVGLFWEMMDRVILNEALKYQQDKSEGS